MRRTLLAACLVLAACPAVRGQESDPIRFEAARQELRGRYARAGSAGEKRAIHAEFQGLELAGRGPEAGPAAPPIAVPAVQPAAPASTGLGSSGDAGPTSRIAILEERIAWTSFELSDAATPDYGVLTSGPLRDTSREVLEQYREGRRELQDWLAAAKAELASLKKGEKPNWPVDEARLSHALSETGAMRRAIAGWVRRHHAQAAETERSNLERLRRALDARRASLERIQKAATDAEQVKQGVKLALAVKSVSEIAQRITDSLADPYRVPGAILGQIWDQVDESGDLIEKAAAGIADYTTRLAALGEGYASAGEAASAIAATLRNVAQTEGLLASHLRRMDEARVREEAPFRRDRR